ncbi:phosphonoacetaldehyde reductase [Alphaproteobacteria bacterium]|nr:phosphonoacetaldehyde reductase [Alphaproteobacteria bacterium]
MSTSISEFGALKRFIELKNIYHKKNILLVTGKNSYSSCGARDILEPILNKENVVYFNDFDCNPKIIDAQLGVNIARKAKIEVIIAVGGGSVIDMAKLIKALYSDPQKYYEIATGKLKIKKINIPIIAVPTTAGSGSEATHFAVVYIDSKKFSVSSPYLTPCRVVLDGELLISGSSYLKTCNALDSLSQAIESLWSKNANKDSRRISLNSIKICRDNIRSFIKGTNNPIILQEMASASHLAGQAINITKTTAPHAWSYAITQNYKIPHGHAVWLTLPSIFQLTLQYLSKKFYNELIPKSLYKEIKEMLELLEINDLTNSKNILIKFLKNLNIEYDMKKLGIDTIEKRTYISNQINIERMSNHPIELDKNDIRKIFEI